MAEIECCHVPECTTQVAVPGGETIYNGDYCIVPELKMLWHLGIRTSCSCCGHGLYEKAYIRVDERDAFIMDALGYELYEPHECAYYGTKTKAYHAKLVKLMHEKGKLPEKRDIREIRDLWKKAAKYGGEIYGI